MEFVKDNIISILALGVSLLSLLISLRKEWKSIVRVGIEPCPGECVYFTMFDHLICYGVIACRVTITNKSNTSCGINDLSLKLGKETYKAKAFDEIVVTNGDDIKFKNIYTHFPMNMPLNSENVFNDLQLQPYQSKKVYITFPASIAIPDEIVYGNKKAKLKIIVANKIFTKKVSVKLISSALKREDDIVSSQGR